MMVAYWLKAHGKKPEFYFFSQNFKANLMCLVKVPSQVFLSWVTTLNTKNFSNFSMNENYSQILF